MLTSKKLVLDPVALNPDCKNTIVGLGEQQKYIIAHHPVAVYNFYLSRE